MWVINKKKVLKDFHLSAADSADVVLGETDQGIDRWRGPPYFFWRNNRRHTLTLSLHSSEVSGKNIAALTQTKWLLFLAPSNKDGVVEKSLILIKFITWDMIECCVAIFILPAVTFLSKITDGSILKLPWQFHILQILFSNYLRLPGESTPRYQVATTDNTSKGLPPRTLSVTSVLQSVSLVSRHARSSPWPTLQEIIDGEKSVGGKNIKRVLLR